jgi:hypothetical protein
MFRTDLESLVNHDVLTVDISSLPEVTKAYDNLISTTRAFTTLFRENWGKIDGNSALKLSHLDRADSLVKDIQQAVGTRDHGEKTIVEAADMRDRAFTVLTDIYEETRSALTYLLRKKGNIDEIAPSLYANRGGRKSTSAKSPDDPQSPSPTAPVAVPKTPAVSSPVAHTTGLPLMPSAPGGNPFTD